MTASTLYDAVIFRTATTGTGTLTAGSAVSRYRNPAQASVADGSTVSYRIDDDNGGWEFGRGTYTVSGTTLARPTILGSSNSGSAINLSGAATVTLILLASDIPSTSGAVTLLTTLTASSSASLSDTTHITSTYNAYLIVFEALLPATNSTKFEVLLSSNSGSTYISSYNAAQSSSSAAYIGAFDISASAGAAAATEALWSNTAANGGISGSVILSNPNASSAGTTVMGNINGGMIPAVAQSWTGAVLGGTNATAVTINAIKFQMSSGNLASGAIKIYGLSN